MRKLDVVDYTYGKRSSDDVNTSLPFTENFKECRTIQQANVVIGAYVNENYKELQNYNEAVEEISEKVDSFDDEKQDKLTAGENVQISDSNVISATDTKYTAGTGIDITNNVISSTGGNAEWGNITGTLSDQTDLQDKFDNIDDLFNGTESMGSIVVDNVTCKNMLNIGLKKLGFYDNSGIWTSSTNYVTFEFIKIDKTKDYSIFFPSLDVDTKYTAIRVVFWNNSYEFISRSNSIYPIRIAQGTQPYFLLQSSDIPDGTKYVSVGVYTAGTASLSDFVEGQMEIGNVPSSYTPFKNFDNTEYILYSKDNPTYSETSYSLNDNPMNYEKIKLYYARYGYTGSIEVYPKIMPNACCTLAYYGNNIPRLYGITFVLNQNSITILNSYYINFIGNNQYQSATYGEGQTNNISLYRVVGVNKIDNLPLNNN